MELSKYQAYIDDAQRAAEENFSTYKIRVGLFAVLGYAVIVILLIVMLGVTGGLLAIAFLSSSLFLLLVKSKLLFVLVPVIWIMARALWVKFEKPQGYELKRKEFPELYAEIDELRRELDSLPVHRVLLTPEFNAAVVQTPRLGVFGWHENTLILGLELLLILTPEQARAVVAHELGHLSGNHSRFNGRIYRVRMVWNQILRQLENNRRFGAGILIRFFDWYAPRFSAYTFPLARFNEYEADAVSAELTSPEDAAAALVQVHVAGPYTDENYWTQYFRRADEVSEPDHPPWEGLKIFLSASSDDDLQDRLDRAMTVETGYADTHPSLKDRLAAIGVSAGLVRPGETRAAEAWFGENREKVLADFDSDWISHNLTAWQNRYEYVQESRASLETLGDKPETALTDDELWRLAHLRREFKDPDETIATFRTYQSRHPDEPDCAYWLGVLLHDKNNPEFLEQLKKSLKDPNFAYDAACIACAYLDAVGGHQELDFWRETLDAAAQDREAARVERQRLQVGDPLLRVDPEEEPIKTILSQLKASKHVGKIWVARKETQFLKNVPCYAIAVTHRGLTLTEDGAAKQILKTVDSFEGWLVPKLGEYKPLAKYIAKHGTRVA